MDDKQIYFGGKVKFISDDKIGGYLVRFSDKNSPDLVGDFFTRETEFGTNENPPAFFHHGLDPVLKSLIIGETKTGIDDVGVWIEAQLEMRDKYERYISGIKKLVEMGKLGWSSGAALVERVPVGDGVNWLKTWIIGDASLTPIPAEPKNLAMPIKSLDANVSIESLCDEWQGKPYNCGNKSGTEKQSENNEVIKMTDETQKNIESLVNERVSVAVESAVENAVKSALDKIPQNETGYAIPKNVQAIESLGDTEIKAFAAFVRTGQRNSAIKASNDTDMNIGTPADGGYAVPTGHYNGIIAAREKGSLKTKLGLRLLPGVGTTTNVPVESGSANVFVSTAEAAAYDRDAPVLDRKQMTLVKYTKKIQLSEELLQDEDSRLIEFLNNYVGRAVANTDNSLILAEVAANGTKFVDFASATSIAFGEPEDLLYNDALDPYIDDGGSVAWVMRHSTYGAIRKITGSDRQYAVDVNRAGKKDLLGYQVETTSYADAIASNAKTLFFGNWYYMGYREAPSMSVIRDPYTLAGTGQVQLTYSFRVVYKVLQASAIGYGQQAA